MSRLDGTVAWLVDDNDNVVGYKRKDGTEGALARLATDAGGNVTGLVGPGGEPLGVLAQAQQDALLVHPRYHCHITNAFAFADSLNIPDTSGAQKHGIAETGLTVGTLHASAGYYSTGSIVNEMIDVPDFNFDWGAGESLLLFWLQKTATPGANKAVFGHVGTAGTAPGLRFMATTAGDLSVGLFNAAGTAAAGVASVAGCFDGNLRGVGIFLNGAAKTFSGWRDTTLVRNNIAWTLADSTATAVNPRIGGTAESTAPQLATKTRAFVVIKFAPGDTLPSVAGVTAAITKLMTNPSRLLSKADL